jgi:hypothetical protein
MEASPSDVALLAVLRTVLAKLARTSTVVLSTHQVTELVGRAGHAEELRS